MPKDIKSNIIQKNLHRLAQLEQVLFAFGIIMCSVTVIRYHHEFNKHLKEFFYYFAYIFTSIHVLLVAIRSVKHPEWPIWRRNRPTYIALFELLVLCVIALAIGSDALSMYTIYINICIITIVMLAVEPVFLISVFVFFSSILTVNLYHKGDYYMVVNICLTTLIMISLSLYKWGSLVTQFKLEKIRDSHIENMEKEINLAAFVQESFSKKKLPELNGYQLLYYSKAMAGVSGDMYDFYTTGNELNGLGIFDVSGHGIASGLVTMLVRNIIQQEFYQNLDKPLEEVMEIIDKRIKKEKRDIENYLTGILLRITGNKVEIVNAGHPSPIIYRDEEKHCEFFDEARQFSSSAIGLTALEVTFKSTSFLLNKGDELVLYTDGVKEAMNSEHNEFGKTRLFISVHNAMTREFSSQLNLILSEMGVFTEDSSQSDDITIVILKKT